MIPAPNAAQSLPVGPPEPRFAYDDINVSSISAISPLVVINNQVCVLFD